MLGWFLAMNHMEFRFPGRAISEIIETEKLVEDIIVEFQLYYYLLQYVSLTSYCDSLEL
jgi:hypothetical protein